MKLGAFSVSLSVKDIKASKIFYEKLGFKQFSGDYEKGHVIMKNQNTLIGLFQGVFEGNLLTFNPGWDQKAQDLDKFDDVRDIQKELKANKVSIPIQANESTKGPASIIITDPDGNTIMIDQHR
jgi:catechol 2,3-dioxygenase-like lactoylglutathione lyase family enzyme|tara:strand:+ start:320 stop:691 length:372 start_codon:yes stop_codon:yes gene_type:complete